VALAIFSISMPSFNNSFAVSIFPFLIPFSSPIFIPSSIAAKIAQFRFNIVLVFFQQCLPG